MTVIFPGLRSGTDALFNEPFWISECARYRILKTNCVRPYRLFRRINKTGFPWIGVDIGFSSREGAVEAANVYDKTRKKTRAKKAKKAVQELTDHFFKGLKPLPFATNGDDQ